MIYFIVDKVNDHYVITNENLVESSPRFQWIRKNKMIFSTESGAQDYLKKQIEERNETKMKRLVEEYDKIENKQDFEYLFNVEISDVSYLKLKQFIDYLKN